MLAASILPGARGTTFKVGEAAPEGIVALADGRVMISGALTMTATDAALSCRSLDVTFGGSDGGW